MLIFLKLIPMNLLSIKQKVLTAMTAHPKLLAFGIALAVPAILSTAIGFIELQEVDAARNTASQIQGEDNACC
jgi:hypothetical protein